MAFKVTLLVLLSFILLTYGKTVVEQAFEDAKLVPDVVYTAPENLLTVKFHSKTVDLGNVLTPDEAGSEPVVQFDGDHGSLYTLIEIDPDAPNLPDHTNIRHWVVTNIPGESSNYEEGDLITEYASPRPPVGDDFHRYTFLVYKQKDKINVEVPEDRKGFDVDKFAQNYTLEGPLFGNFFKAQRVE